MIAERSFESNGILIRIIPVIAYIIIALLGVAFIVLLLILIIKGIKALNIYIKKETMNIDK